MDPPLLRVPANCEKSVWKTAGSCVIIVLYKDRFLKNVPSDGKTEYTDKKDEGL